MILVAGAPSSQRHVFIPPMKASSGPIPTGSDWLAELKWDGMRVQAAVVGGTVSLFSGSGRDITTHFPELAALSDAVDLDAVFDGEVAVFDGTRPSFHRLQHRIHVRKPPNSLLAEQPVVFLAFDLLALDQQSLLDVPLVDRRRLLHQVLDDGPSWRVPQHSDNAEDLLDLARTHDLEGIVCKRSQSTYRPGRRTPNWVKVKLRTRQEFVVGGWLEGTGGLRGNIGSLLIGVYGGTAESPTSELHFAGSVGSGLSDDTRRNLSDGFTHRGTSPFATVPTLDKRPHWVEPLAVVEVEYSIWDEGSLLWHPSFRGIRIDRDPTEVVRETAAPQ